VEHGRATLDLRVDRPADPAGRAALARVDALELVAASVCLCRLDVLLDRGKLGPQLSEPSIHFAERGERRLARRDRFSNREVSGDLVFPARFTSEMLRGPTVTA
jgi:hypothetical protein